MLLHQEGHAFCKFPKVYQVQENRRAEKWHTIGLNRSSGQCPGWVKKRNAHCEQMFSALPLIADLAQCGRHVRFVPCTHSRVVMRRCLGIDHGPPVTYQYALLNIPQTSISAE
jgi:hypothetical protein